MIPLIQQLVSQQANKLVEVYIATQEKEIVVLVQRWRSV